MSERPDAQAAANQFEFSGEVLSLTPHGSGHINDTFLVTCQAPGAPVRYILQHINRHVFHDPVAVMRNIERVTAHLAAQAAGEPDGALRALRLVPARDGRNWHVDAQGETWRAYHFIENARTYDTATSTGQAFQAARAFGHFQQQLSSLPPPRLHETIPDFHNTPKRFAALEQAIAADAAGRVALAKPEIDFARSRKAIT